MSTGKWSGDTNHWHNKRLARQKQLFLKGLAERGTVRAASEVCGIDRKTAYRWRAADEEFSRAGILPERLPLMQSRARCTNWQSPAKT
jgi:hypothetical protein